MRIPPATPKLSLLVAIALVAGALGCASTPPQRQVITDEHEGLNRSLFAFNEWFDDHAFGPAARGYKRVTPEPLRIGFANAERNLGFPQRFVATLGQAKFQAAGSELGRFLLNSTLGMGGLLDPASEIFAKHDDDLGLMLASWHVPPGSFLMLPVIGPSNARDSLADLAGMAMNPLAWTTSVSGGVTALFMVNRRAEADDKIRIARASALDYYVFVRDAFIQRRTQQVRGDYVSRLREGEIPDDPMGMPEDAYDVQAEVTGTTATH